MIPPPEYKIGRMQNYLLEWFGKFHLMRKLTPGDEKLITLCSVGSCGASRIELVEDLDWADLDDGERCKVCERARAAALRRYEAADHAKPKAGR